ncbi:MAG: hypothetical protein KDD25_00005, partial [Bdellovibrionales bacterium]|nr:hypothetical protein [Bdellovibrionales bacterium]
QIPGFYFGRVDIKFDTIEDLETGIFDLIEVNGAGAESTNIYDPRKSKREVYRILARQWTLAFSIGSENRRIQKRQKSDLPVFLYRWLYKKC